MEPTVSKRLISYKIQSSYTYLIEIRITNDSEGDAIQLK